MRTRETWWGWMRRRKKTKCDKFAAYGRFLKAEVIQTVGEDNDPDFHLILLANDGTLWRVNIVGPGKYTDPFTGAQLSTVGSE